MQYSEETRATRPLLPALIEQTRCLPAAAGRMPKKRRPHPLLRRTVTARLPCWISILLLINSVNADAGFHPFNLDRFENLFFKIQVVFCLLPKAWVLAPSEVEGCPEPGGYMTRSGSSKVIGGPLHDGPPINPPRGRSSGATAFGVNSACPLRGTRLIHTPLKVSGYAGRFEGCIISGKK